MTARAETGFRILIGASVIYLEKQTWIDYAIGENSGGKDKGSSGIFGNKS